MIGMIVRSMGQIHCSRLFSVEHKPEVVRCAFHAIADEPVRETQERLCRDSQHLSRRRCLRLAYPPRLDGRKMWQPQFPRGQEDHCDAVAAIAMKANRAATAACFVIRMWRDHQDVHGPCCTSW